MVGKPKGAAKREAAPVIKKDTPEKPAHPKAAVIAAFKNSLGMTTLGEGVPEKGSRGRQVDVKVGQATRQTVARDSRRRDQEQPSPSEFESPRLHQNPKARVPDLTGIPESVNENAFGNEYRGISREAFVRGRQLGPDRAKGLLDWLEEEGGRSVEEQEPGQAESAGGSRVQAPERSSPAADTRDPVGASEAVPVRGRSPGVVPEAPVAAPVYESITQEVDRRVKEECDRDPEINANALRPGMEIRVKQERRQKALEQAESPEVEPGEFPDYANESQQIRAGRRKR